IISLGGTYNSKSNSFIGEMARQNLECFNPNKIFIGVGGINVDKMQISTSTIDEGKFKSTALNIGQDSYIVTQSKKFFQDSIFNFSKIKDGMTIITDGNIPSDIETKLNESGVRVIK
ncbi:MAG: hypothetical protein ACRC45_02495, partial [Cetobacterium sp.]